MRVMNASKNIVLVDNCRTADTFISRFLGLMGKPCLPSDSGLVITPCNSIHMFFMRFPLDVVFVDRNNTVVSLVENIKPWRVSGIAKKARSAIELTSGTIKRTQTEIGDKLEFTYTD